MTVLPRTQSRQKRDTIAIINNLWRANILPSAFIISAIFLTRQVVLHFLIAGRKK
jgi:hypothetical protein